MLYQTPCHELVWRKEGKFNTFITSTTDKDELPASSPIAPGERTLVPENCAFLGYFAASSGNSLPTFRNKLSVPSSRVRIQGDSSSTSLRKPQSTTLVPFGQKIGWTPELVWKTIYRPFLKTNNDFLVVRPVV